MRHCNSAWLSSFSTPFVLVFAGIILIVPGCGASGDRYFPGRIQGTVTCDSVGLENASISFEGGPSGTFGGKLEDGKYFLENVAVGTYDVVIYPIAQGQQKLDPSAPAYDPILRADIPTRYRSALTSGIKATITSGSNTLDVRLERENL